MKTASYTLNEILPRTPTVTVLTWVSDRKPLDDPRYRLVHERAFSRQKVSTYALR